MAPLFWKIFLFFRSTENSEKHGTFYTHPICKYLSSLVRSPVRGNFKKIKQSCIFDKKCIPFTNSTFWDPRTAANKKNSTK